MTASESPSQWEALAELRASVAAHLRMALELERDFSTLASAIAEPIGQDDVAHLIGDARAVLKLAGLGATARHTRALWTVQDMLSAAASAIRAGEAPASVRRSLNQAEAETRELARAMATGSSRAMRSAAYIHATRGVTVAADLIGRCLAATSHWAGEGHPPRAHVAPVVPLDSRRRGRR